MTGHTKRHHNVPQLFPKFETTFISEERLRFLRLFLFVEKNRDFTDCYYVCKRTEEVFSVFVSVKLRPHQQQCRSNIRLRCQKWQQCRTSLS